MNLFVADPDWGWWIVVYFFLGGLAAGCYFMATLIDLMGHDSDRELARLGYRLAFPLVLICGVLLILDLHEPKRFWHMLLKSEVVKEAVEEGWPWSGGWSRMIGAPLFKYWSPMSIGAWALLLFGICSGLSFLGSLWPEGRLFQLFRRGIFGRVLQLAGCLVGFFVAAYTGTLLSATNQPVWSDSIWIAPLFMTSATSTAIAVMIVLARYRVDESDPALQRLEHADVWALGMELICVIVFLLSLGDFLGPVLSVGPGKLLVLGTLFLGVLLPLAWHLRLGIGSLRSELFAAILVLVGGFVMRYAILSFSPEFLKHGPAAMAGFGPEAVRLRGGGAGADPGNKPAAIQPRSKVFEEQSP